MKLTDIQWIDSYCMGKRGTTKAFKEEWGWMRYFVEGKPFAIIGFNDNQEILLTVRTDTAYSEMLQQEYQAIVPGYYCNKLIYTTVWFDVDEIPEKDRHQSGEDIYPNRQLMQEMIDKSYLIQVSKLSKKKQQMLLEQ
ncbi:MmcQ/YjbR family DNA-binding protein [Beduini massiliensis]|uniref:MmcQ/YjbR family DNA-binding protein n=1 Tax=Beduini massiliensis TaxID=1585974 RepID=UPI00059AAD07|nr:MmcQ/YjbR family DNA-binding protein [Beduini massiliensis]